MTLSRRIPKDLLVIALLGVTAPARVVCRNNDLVLVDSEAQQRQKELDRLLAQMNTKKVEAIELRVAELAPDISPYLVDRPRKKARINSRMKRSGLY